MSQVAPAALEIAQAPVPTAAARACSRDSRQWRRWSSCMAVLSACSRSQSGNSELRQSSLRVQQRESRCERRSSDQRQSDASWLGSRVAQSIAASDRVHANLLAGHHVAEQRERRRFLDVHRHRLADRAAGCRRRRRCGRSCVRPVSCIGPGRVRASSAFLLGPSTSTSTRLADAGGDDPARLTAFWIASRSLLRRFFTSSGTSSAIQLVALGAGPGAVLEDEAVLEAGRRAPGRRSARTTPPSRRRSRR